MSLTADPALPDPSDLEVASERPTRAPERILRRRVVVGLLAVVVAFHASFWSLLRGTTVDTPLAYLGLVPFVALGLAAVLSRPKPDEPEIHDRHLDRIAAVPLLAVPVVSMALLPARMSTMFWLWRIDLLVLPLFVAGVVALLFGIRMLWRTKVAVFWLFLAWPVPARFGVTMLLDPLSKLTAAAVRVAVGIVPLATPVNGDGITFAIGTGKEAFRVQVASACSGANSLVGFLLVASAVAVVLRGPKAAKFRWLLVGSFFVWALNVFRILLILGVGRTAGRTASIEVLHPMIGMFTFAFGVLVMVLNVHRFGLDLPSTGGRSRSESVLKAVPDARRATVVVVVLAAVCGLLDSRLSNYDPIASAIGSPRLGTFAQVASRPPGYRARPVATIDAGQRFFGEDSTWLRWSFNGPGQPDLYSDVPVLADVVSTSNVQTFSDFGLEACYRFHGYDMAEVRSVDLGNGVVGTVLNWKEPSTGLRWTTVYWVWAVRAPAGVRYERVVLLLNDSKGAKVVAPEVTPDAAADFALKADELVRGRIGSAVTARDVELRTFLVTFARRVVASASERSAQLPKPQEPGR